MSELVIEPVAVPLWPAALDLLFQHLPVEERQICKTNTLQLLKTSQIDPSGLLGAFRQQTLLGVMLCVLAPGAIGLVWPPQALEGKCKTDAEDALVRAILGRLRSHGAKLAQVLLEADQTQEAEPLLRNGIARVTELLYLRHELGDELAALVERSPLRFTLCTQALEAQLQRTLMATYAGSQDCPEVDGLRTVNEILAGHRAQGRHNPASWWLAEDESGPVGVLLVNRIAEEPGWDLIYMGIVPAARGRGFGRQLIRQALTVARENGMRFVELCVDRRNSFARNLYRELGFECVAERVLYLARLRQVTS